MLCEVLSVEVQVFKLIKFFFVYLFENFLYLQSSSVERFKHSKTEPNKFTVEVTKEFLFTKTHSWKISMTNLINNNNSIGFY